MLDASRVLAGPYCAYLLGLLGADVMRVERPQGDSVRWRSRANPSLGGVGLSTDYIAQAANKRVVYLDLSQARDREAFLKQLSNSDVLVENFRTGALARLGLDDQAMLQAQPSLIWCSIRAYGERGPQAAFPAYDSVIQAASGLMQLTGDSASGPMKAGAPLIDYATGMNAALGVVSAVLAQVRKPGASRVEVSMLDSALALMQSTVSGHLNGEESLTGRGNAASSGNALSQCYETADGRICIAVNEPHQRRALLQVLGVHEPDSSARSTDTALVTSVIAKVKSRASAELAAALNRAGVPSSPVQSLDAAVAQALEADPDFARPMPGDLSLRCVGLPFRLNGSRGRLESGVEPHPDMGIHGN